MAGCSILFVDDERDIVELAMLSLSEAGYAVQPAASGDIALILLEQRLPFALLITDIIMPGLLDGFALARRARQLRPGLPVIYTTGFAQAAAIRASGAPLGPTLPKPWKPSGLVKLVGEIIKAPESVKNPHLL